MLIRILEMVFMFVFIFFVVACTKGYVGPAGGYKEICDIFSESQDVTGTVGEIWIIVGDKVEKDVSDESALKAYSAFTVSNPNTRYQDFKAAVEDDIGREWRCEPMRLLLEQAVK